MYNHPKVLDSLIRRLARKMNQTEKENMVFICFALQRAERRKVLVKYGFPDQANLTDRDQQNELFHMLLHYSGCREEIVSIIKWYSKLSLPSIYIFRDSYRVHLNCPTNQHCFKSIGSVEFIQLMPLGQEIDLIHLQSKHIMKTCPCIVYPLTTHFYIVKLGFTGVYNFFLFLLQNIDCG